MATFVKHEPCPSCGSRDNLGRYSDGSAFCFGCHYTERATTSPFVGERDGKTQEYGTGDVFQQYREASNHIHGRGLAWLSSYGITATEALRAGFRWSDSWEQLLMPLYDGDNHLVCVQAKNFNPKRASKAKYYNIGDKSDSMTVYGDSATLILTEDILSAIKVSHGYMGMPLLGTHISRSKLAKVCQGIERLVVWLDEDKWREARDIADAAKLIGINAKTLLTPKDPKEYNGTEIVQLVG